MNNKSFGRYCVYDVNSSDLVFSLSSDRHSYIGLVFISRFIEQFPPESDGTLRVVVRKKILHYHQVIDTTDRIYDDFTLGSMSFSSCCSYANIKGSVGLIFGESFGHEDFYTV
jgi:hypothetical protein